MKKLMLLGVAAFIAVAASLATVSAAVPGGCGVSQCGGGDDKCCSEGGATYYMKAKAPVAS